MFNNVIDLNSRSPKANSLKVKFMRLNDDAVIPTYATQQDAGADLSASEDVLLHKNGGRAIVPTGLALALPEGFVGLIHPRSGLAAKHGVTVTNAPGTIDSGYRGEIKVLLINHGDEHIGFLKGDRIAQLVIQPVIRAEFVEYITLPESDRGNNGFGSTDATAA